MYDQFLMHSQLLFEEQTGASKDNCFNQLDIRRNTKDSTLNSINLNFSISST